MQTRPQTILSQVLTRPADTTAYASGDLVANSTTANLVTPFRFQAASRQTGYKSIVRRAGLLVSQNLLTNGTFRLHFFSAAPTVTNGDNGALDIASNLVKYMGYKEIILSQGGTGQGAIGWSSPVATNNSGDPQFMGAQSQDIWGLLEARAAYVPASAQTMQALLELDQY